MHSDNQTEVSLFCPNRPVLNDVFILPTQFSIDTQAAQQLLKAVATTFSLWVKKYDIYQF